MEGVGIKIIMIVKKHKVVWNKQVDNDDCYGWIPTPKKHLNKTT